MKDEGKQYTVYFAFCPEHGPEHRFYGEEDVQRLGSVLSIEKEIEAETYWFVRLGTLIARRNSYEGRLSHSFTFSEGDIARLPYPPVKDYRVGRGNPAFGRSELELQIFESIFHAVKTRLDNWKSKGDDGLDEGYAVKKLKITSDRISELATTLAATGTAIETIEITVLQYLYDEKCARQILTEDDALDELPFVAVVELQSRRDSHDPRQIEPLGCVLVDLASASFDLERLSQTDAIPLRANENNGGVR